MKRLLNTAFVLFIGGAIQAQVTDGYTYLKKIEINGTQIAGAGTHINFPVFIQLTDPTLRTVDYDGSLYNAEAWDLIFTTDDCEEQLAHEVEYYDPSTGELVCWVNVPELTAGEDKTIHMVYSNSGLIEDPAIGEVWENAYTGVFHFDQLDDTTDHSIFENDVTNYFVENSDDGMIKGARLFDDLSDYVEVGYEGMDGINGSVSMWAKPNQFSLPSRYFFGHTSIPSYENRIQLYSGHWTVDSNALNLGFGDAHLKKLEMAFLDTNEWIHLACTWNSNELITKVYLNGEEVAAEEFTGFGLYGMADIGNNGSEVHDQGFDGIIDEVHIANEERTAGWIKTAFNNQSDPAAFFMLSDEFLTEEICAEDVVDDSTDDVSIKKVFLETKFFVYPNPANDLLNITYPEIDETVTLTIYNMQGKLIQSQVLGESKSENVIIDLLNYAPGFYYVEFTSANYHMLRTFVVAK